jgi:hypothetical protein
MTLPKSIKDAATAAFRDNTKLGLMPTNDREQAARFYEYIAGYTVGTKSELARLYNLERARFLRGQVRRIASNANEFAVEIRYIEKFRGEDDV